MDRRLELQALLEELLGSGNVYFQPPESFKLVYPCIVYKKETFNVWRANNGVYKAHQPYQVTLIYHDPDYELPKTIAELPYCRHDRNFVANNLYHDVFTLYY